MSLGTWAGQDDFKEFFEITSGAGQNYALHVVASVQLSVVAQICVQIISVCSNMCSEYLGKEDGIIYKANVDESHSQSCCCASRFIKNLCFDLFSSDFMEHEYE